MNPAKKTQVESLREKIFYEDTPNQEINEEEFIKKVQEELDGFDLDEKIEQYFTKYKNYNATSYRWNLNYLKENILRLTLLEAELKRRTKSTPFHKRISTYLKMAYNKEYKEFLKYDLDDLVLEYTKQLDKVGTIYCGTLKKARDTQKQIQQQMDKFTYSLLNSNSTLDKLSEKNAKLEEYYSTIETMLSKLNPRDEKYYFLRNLKTKLFTQLYAVKSERRVSQLKMMFSEQQYQILDLASQMLSYIIMNAETGLNYVLNTNETVKSLTTAFGDIKELTHNMGYLNNGLKSLYTGLADLWNSSFENVKEMRNMTKTDILSKNFGLDPNLEANIKSLIADSLEILDDEYLSSL